MLAAGQPVKTAGLCGSSCDGLAGFNFL